MIKFTTTLVLLTASAWGFAQASLNSFPNGGGTMVVDGGHVVHIGLVGQPMGHGSVGGTLIVSTIMFATDVHPPEVTFDPGAFSVHVNTPNQLSFVATDNIGIESSKIYYKPIAQVGAPQSVVTLAGSNNSFSKPIEASWFDRMGIAYYLEVKDKQNTTRHPATGYHYAYAIDPAPQIPTTLLSYGKTKNNYRIISIPYTTDLPITQIFEELGPSDKKKYRIYKRESTTFSEYPAFTTIKRGEGYFIIMDETLSNVLLTMPEFSAPANNQSNLFQLELKPGWNLIGNPYTLDINWDDVRAFNSNPTMLATDIKVWKGDGQFTNAKELKAFQGGFVWLNGSAPLQIQIPFKGQTSANSGGRLSDKDNSNGWTVSMTVADDESVSTSTFGMNDQAALGFDAFDDLQPPAPMPVLSIKFDHPEHGQKFFIRDFVPLIYKHTWHVDIPSLDQKFRQLTWTLEQADEAVSDLYLYDMNANTVIDMKATSHYSIPSSSQQFKIFYGLYNGNEFRPDVITMLPPYPNPVQSGQQSTFSIGLPQAENPYAVELKLFDARGVNIFEGTWNLNAGLHALSLPAQEMPANGELLYYILSIGKDCFRGKILHKP